MIWRSGVYRRLLICAQKTGALPRICTKLNLSDPTTAGAMPPMPRPMAPVVLLSATPGPNCSMRMICSVSTKLAALPSWSMPRVKKRVPARWRERREMSPKVKARPEMEHCRMTTAVRMSESEKAPSSDREGGGETHSRT